MEKEILKKINTTGIFEVDYNTTTGRVYPLEVGYAAIESFRVPVNIPETTQACMQGCRLYGRNGGCPPFSPAFQNICNSDILILYSKLLTKHYPPRVLNGSYYLRWAFVETFMTSLMNRIGKNLSSALGAYFLSSGNCQSCRPRRCAVKDGKRCREPHARTYSLESTGVLVTKLTRDVFGLELQWWRLAEPKHIPEYMVKVIGLTKEGIFNPNETKNLIIKSLKTNRGCIH